MKTSQHPCGDDQDVLHFRDQLAKLTGLDLGASVRLLTASMREAMPAAVEEGVKAAVGTHYFRLRDHRRRLAEPRQETSPAA